MLSRNFLPDSLVASAKPRFADSSCQLLVLRRDVRFRALTGAVTLPPQAALADECCRTTRPARLGHSDIAQRVAERCVCRTLALLRSRPGKRTKRAPSPQVTVPCRRTLFLPRRDQALPALRRTHGNFDATR